MKPPRRHRPRIGRWLPPHHHVEAWVGELSRQVARKKKARLHPAVDAFRRLIDEDPTVRMYVTRMIAEVPDAKPYQINHVRSVEEMLAMIDEVMGRAPEFDTTALVGAPLNAILDWAMGTPAGFAAFRHPPINAAIKQILEAWRVFLDSPKSLYVLNDSPSGWKSPAARAAIGIDDYEHDPSDTHWGFASWNDFFIRRFKPGRRPIAEPSNARAIANACESTPYAIARNVNKYDTFWLKSQPYSLHDMLAGDEAAKRFVGGTVYQAFLSALNYHRWHSPVAGTVRKAVVLPGTYYSELEAEGEDPAGPGLHHPCRDQGPDPDRERRGGHWPHGLSGGGHVGDLLLRHRAEDQRRRAGREGRGNRLFPVRRLDPLPDLRPRRDRRFRPRRPARPGQPGGAGAAARREARHRQLKKAATRL
jgi:phosphatidylserine decarboxylase